VVGEHHTVGTVGAGPGGVLADLRAARRAERGGHDPPQVEDVIGADQTDRLVEGVKQQHRLWVQMHDGIDLGPHPVRRQVQPELRCRRGCGAGREIVVQCRPVGYSDPNELRSAEAVEPCPSGGYPALVRAWQPGGQVSTGPHHEAGLHDRMPYMGQLVAQVTGDVVQCLPWGLLGRTLARRGQKVGDRADRGWHEAVERPHATLFPLQQTGLGQDSKVMAHRGL
jgi:hypothetical protein